MAFEIGESVNRVEDREGVGGTVIDVQPDPDGAGDICLITYDEGGEGWWPEALLEAAV